MPKGNRSKLKYEPFKLGYSQRVDARVSSIKTFQPEADRNTIRKNDEIVSDFFRKRIKVERE